MLPVDDQPFAALAPIETGRADATDVAEHERPPSLWRTDAALGGAGCTMQPRPQAARPHVPHTHKILHPFMGLHCSVSAYAELITADN